jgi:hypothetical protein
MLGNPRANVLSVGLPRIVEARDDAGRSRAPARTIPPDFEPIDRPLLNRVKNLEFRPAAQRGGTVKNVRGVLPVEVMVQRQDLVTVADVEKAVGRTIQGNNGFRLTVKAARRTRFRIDVQLALTVSPGWQYHAESYGIDVLDGQNFYRCSNPYFNRAVRREARPEDLAWLGVEPSSGFPANVPWLTLAMSGNKGNVGPTQWEGVFSFPLADDAGTDLKLVFYGFERAWTEVPFEFHDLPLP